MLGFRHRAFWDSAALIFCAIEPKLEYGRIPAISLFEMPDEKTADEKTADELLTEKLGEMIQGLEARLEERMNSAITGLGTKLNKKLTSTVQEQIDSKVGGDSLSAQIEASLSKVLDAAISPSDDVAEATPTSAESPTAALENLLEAKLAEQQAASAEQLRQYEQRITQMQQAVEEERMASRKASTRDGILRALSGKVVRPESFWRDVEAELSVQFDAEKGYGTRTEDEFGNPVFTPVTEVLPRLLTDEKFAHHVVPRPGQGADVRPGVNGQQPPVERKTMYSADATLSPAERTAQLKKRMLSGSDIFEEMV